MLTRIVRADIAAIAAQPLPWQAFDGATVVITGAAGLLPTYLVETLLALRAGTGARPERVVGLVRNLDKAQARFGHHQDRRDLLLLAGDVTAPPPIDGPADFVIHAASQASPRFYGTDPAGTISANVLGTHQMLELARRKSSRGLLFFSSSEIYGEPARVPTREEDYGRLDPAVIRSCYAEGKRAGETLCVSWSHQYGVPTHIVRPFHTYGPGMALDDGRVFADFVADVLARRDIVMKSAGTATRAFCYIADATAGFFTVLLKGEVARAYNIGSDIETSIVGLAEILAGEFAERNIAVVRRTDGDQQPYLPSVVSRSVPDITRARALGWAPSTKLAPGFRRTVESLEEAMAAG